MPDENHSTPIWSRFYQSVTAQSKKPAIIDALDGSSLTYGELNQAAITFQTLFEEFRIDAIAIIGEPDLDAIPLVLSCALVNKCFIPLSQDDPSSRIRQVLDQIPYRTGTLSLREVPEVFDSAPRRLKLGRKSYFFYLKNAKTTAPDLAPPYLLTQSSGSTGEPKLIAFAQGTKVRRTDQSIELFSVTHQDVILSSSPLHHSLGQRHLFVALLSGATLVKLSPFNPIAWLEAVKRFAVSFAIPVSTHLKILRPELERDPSVLSTFRCLVASSATADADLKARLLKNTDFELWEIYGMTETACATAVRFSKTENVSHVGKAISGTNIRISPDSEEGQGEIEVLSDCLCDGYLNNDSLWESSITEDGYFRSGDLGYFDDNENLVFLGRTTESFESCGLLIFPAEIERVASKFPGVRDCVAFPIPNEIFGNLIALAVLGDADLGRRDLLAYLREELSKNKVPAQLFIQQAFPTLPSGKLDKHKLMREILDGQAILSKSAEARS